MPKATFVLTTSLIHQLRETSTSLSLGLLVGRCWCLFLLHNLLLKLGYFCWSRSLGSYSGGSLLNRGWFLLCFWIFISLLLICWFLSNWFLSIFLSNGLLYLLWRRLRLRFCRGNCNWLLFIILLYGCENFARSLLLGGCLDNSSSLTFNCSMSSWCSLFLSRRSILFLSGLCLHLLFFFLALSLVVTLLFHSLHWGCRTFGGRFLWWLWFFGWSSWWHLRCCLFLNWSFVTWWCLFSGRRLGMMTGGCRRGHILLFHNCWLGVGFNLGWSGGELSWRVHLAVSINY